MEILNHYEELVGKKIAFSHMAQFAEQITIATEDGSVLMASFDVTDDEDVEIRVLHPRKVLSIIKSDRGRYIRQELGKLGIFDTKQYEKEQAEIQEERRKKWKIEKEKKELELFEELKAKYENDAE